MNMVILCPCCHKEIGKQDFLRVDRGLIHADCYISFLNQVAHQEKPMRSLDGDETMNFTNCRGMEISIASTIRPFTSSGSIVIFKNTPSFSAFDPYM